MEKIEPYLKKNYHKALVDREGFPRADLDFGELIAYRELTVRKIRNPLLINLNE